MKQITGFFVFLALVFGVGAHAETTKCKATITTLPYTIAGKGVYCLGKDISINRTTGSAITIASSNVVLDLNGHMISGDSAGSATMAYGIYSLEHKNVTIKNGIVRGFWYGVVVDGNGPPFDGSSENVVEGIHAEENMAVGIYVRGKNNIVRNNLAQGSGGTTSGCFPDCDAYGLSIGGDAARVLNNDVIGVDAQGVQSGYGLFMRDSPNSVVEGNRVSNVGSDSGSAYGIYIGNFFAADGSNQIVSDNRVSDAQYGIYFDGTTTGTYMNNVVRGADTAYTGGTAAGTTNY